MIHRSGEEQAAISLVLNQIGQSCGSPLVAGEQPVVLKSGSTTLLLQRHTVTGAADDSVSSSNARFA